MKSLPRLPEFLRAAGQLTGLAAWQTGRLFRRATRAALEAVQEVLRAEVEKGNLQQVREFLAGKALPAVRALLLERMATRLLVRLGLRGALASNVVGWVLPFVVEQLLKVAQKSGVFDKVRDHTTVQEALRRLEELKQVAWKRLSPDHGTGAELLPDGTPLPPQLSA
ncbi:hypothetical protein ACFPAF_00180 [Hymenobacter endophyticus]|uniref:DUF937 domain-containing protein n=1 Tax=Hymenobacter endophyticus TaxID=3076335 RepID=A0ABU3TBP1_9BACT|nr:hypothetical protein [Hymenobacter endophyticus]MDU0368794.1 hypothetical protein [Hymenobacter endophyticus]